MIHSSFKKLSIYHPIILQFQCYLLKRCENIFTKDLYKNIARKLKVSQGSINREWMDKTMYLHIISTNSQLRIYIYIYVCVCVCVCIYIYMYIYIHFVYVYVTTLKVQVAQSCLTLQDPMDYIVHGILQPRIPEWVAYPFSSGSSQPRNQTEVSYIAGRFFVN